MTDDCLPVCGDKQYLSGEQCLPCSEPCAQCSGASTSCADCIDGYAYIPDSHTCQSNCTEGQRLTPENICEPCPLGCSTCDAANICSDCVADKFLFEGLCISACPVKFYSNEGSCAGISDCLEFLFTKKIIFFSLPRKLQLMRI